MKRRRVKKNMVTMRRLSGGVLTVEKVKLMDVLRLSRARRASRASAGIDGNAKPSGTDLPSILALCWLLRVAYHTHNQPSCVLFLLIHSLIHSLINGHHILFKWS